MNETLTVLRSFDSDTNWLQWTKAIGDIRDKSDCGCCWASGGAEEASDRTCITSNVAFLMPLSAQDVCFFASSDECNDGQIDTPWDYIKSHGAVPEGQQFEHHAQKRSHSVSGRRNPLPLHKCMRINSWIASFTIESVKRDSGQLEDTRATMTQRSDRNDKATGSVK